MTTRLESNSKANKADVEEQWKILRNIVVKSAETAVGYAKRSEAKKPWITDQMLEKMEERRKWKHQSTDKAKSKYKKLNNELRRFTDEAKLS